MGNFFSKIFGFFGKLFGKAPTVLQRISSAITFISPATTLLLTETAGSAEAAEVTNVVNEIQSDLGLAASLVSQAHATGSVPAQVNSLLAEVDSNFSALMTAGHVKNPTTQALITAGLGEFKAVLGAIAPAPATPVTASA